ncbi:Spo11/DNA topoisomerase VI subunit A [Cercophora scortea]|uniref:Spo11/DNA topoisomerase VI subunit A n=1 Tax=Cercophora scortea TaxID=314031 RepID=A0AAE0MDH0_9PEZI|nr:Spo11/DNA topoisomerase VI subunit A [Cercophora scortea]
MVRFPGQTVQETRKFEALFCILELAHEALLSGNLITLRNIYYQNMELFVSQAVVNVMIDSLASTLGVGRWDLNIGILLPSINSIEKIDFHSVKWVLVIEKEATFRTLAASQYHQTSKAGHGILITDANRLPLSQGARARLNSGSQRDRPTKRSRTDRGGDPVASITNKPFLQKAENRGVTSLQQSISTEYPEANHLGHEQRLEEELVHGVNENAISHHGAGDPVNSTMTLTQTDRKKVVSILNEICTGEGTVCTAVSMEQKQELQRMLVLNIKAEIQAVDHFGDITKWLDEKLCKW